MEGSVVEAPSQWSSFSPEVLRGLLTLFALFLAICAAIWLMIKLGIQQRSIRRELRQKEQLVAELRLRAELWAELRAEFLAVLREELLLLETGDRRAAEIGAGDGLRAPDPLHMAGAVPVFPEEVVAHEQPM